jgi:CheY-like chemotaxis protein
VSERAFTLAPVERVGSAEPTDAEYVADEITDIGLGDDILVVDDRPANLIAVEAALAPLGRKLVFATSGVQALARLLDQDFALILLDVAMPGITGIETARLIRSRERSRGTPIVFVTAMAWQDEAIDEAYEVGGYDFLIKPVRPEVLRAKVRVFLKLQERTRKRDAIGFVRAMVIAAATGYGARTVGADPAQCSVAPAASPGRCCACSHERRARGGRIRRTGRPGDPRPRRRVGAVLDSLSRGRGVRRRVHPRVLPRPAGQFHRREAARDQEREKKKLASVRGGRPHPDSDGYRVQGDDRHDEPDKSAGIAPDGPRADSQPRAGTKNSALGALGRGDALPV